MYAAVLGMSCKEFDPEASLEQRTLATTIC